MGETPLVSDVISAAASGVESEDSPPRRVVCPDDKTAAALNVLARNRRVASCDFLRLLSR